MSLYLLVITSNAQSIGASDCTLVSTNALVIQPAIGAPGIAASSFPMHTNDTTISYSHIAFESAFANLLRRPSQSNSQFLVALAY